MSIRPTLRPSRLGALVACLLAAASAGASDPKLLGIDVNPDTVIAGQQVEIKIVLDQPGASPVLSTLGETEALAIGPTAVPIYGSRTVYRRYTTASFSDRTRQVQVRAELGGEVHVANLRVMPAAATTPPPARRMTETTAEYVFDTPTEVRDLVQYSTKKGFRFRSAIVPGPWAGRCNLSLNPIVRGQPTGVDFPVTGQIPNCTYSFFEGPRLADGWNLVAASFRGGPGQRGIGHSLRWSWANALEKTGGEASFAVTSSEALNGDYLDLTRLVLRGPRDRNWREALDGARP